MKKMPVPITFAIVIFGIFALFIFFGAWAVSVDAAEKEQSLTAAIVNSTLGYSAVTAADANQTTLAPHLASLTDNTSAADTWWGQSLITVCPLH
jgi:hypothetical protein